jgi:Transposase DDE domain
MQAVQLLHKFVKKSCPQIHTNRINALFIAVAALIVVGKLSLSGLGRSLTTGAKVKNNIKRIDRLLGNKNLHIEKDNIYDVVTKLIIASTKKPPIIVDWSSLPDKKFHLLRAAVPTNGRSLTVYEEVHPVKKLNNHKVHKNFLKKLFSMLPIDCKPIIITDAGFHSPFFREVEKLQWDWIGRIRNLTKYKEGDKWIACSSLHKKASRIPVFITKTLLSKSTPIECSVFLYKGKKKGRIDKNQAGKRVKGEYSRTIAKGNKEPWVLATSLHGGFRIAKKVIRLFRRRMQIEEGFRDVKNSRLGFSLEESKTYTRVRFEILLLIALLAIFVVTLLGKIGVELNLQYDYQANTVRNKPVLSLFFLGCQMIRQGNIDFNRDDFWGAISLIVASVTYLSKEEL